ncbi:MAG: dTMP kinase [Bacillota bacterium]
MKGFVTLEGCEGVGKSTQIRFLKEYLKNTSQEAVFTREPGGTVVAEKIRDIILNEKMDAICEAHLFAAARAEHINSVIIPSIKKNKLVICDRYIDSSFAYQGFARELGLEKVIEINDYAVKNCMPECTIFLDMNPLNSWRKQKGKVVNDRMEGESGSFHLKVYEGFMQLCKKYPQRFVKIIPHKDKLITFERIKSALQDRGVIK